MWFAPPWPNEGQNGAPRLFLPPGSAESEDRMNCANHADASAVAYCRTCGKPLCSACSRDVRGVMYCEECLAAHVSGTALQRGAVPAAMEPPPGAPNPRLAALLGWIP